MITAMTLLAIILAVTVLTAVSYGVLYLVEYIRTDGYGRLGGTNRPPRSHYPDSFDPHSGPTRLA
jgi:hypothetical protein